MASVVPSDSFQNSQRSDEELLQKAIVNNEFVELEIGEVIEVGVKTRVRVSGWQMAARSHRNNGSPGLGGRHEPCRAVGCEAGLRCGELMALEWTDVDLEERQLCVGPI